MNRNDPNLSSDHEAKPLLALSGPAASSSERPLAAWHQAAASPAFASAPSADATTYLHALRRHWALALVLGLLLAAVIGPAIWFLFGARYTASAFLRVSALEQALVFPTQETEHQTEFEIFKATQQQLLSSRFVLNAATRDPEIANLPSVRAEKDEVGWLAEELRVHYPGDAEIMEVSLQGTNPREVETLVNAVVDAYLRKVVVQERNQRGQRLDKLDNVYIEKEKEARAKRTRLRQLVEQVGTGDIETLSLKQQNAMQELAAYRSQWMQVQFQLMRAQGDWKAKQAELQALAEAEISDMELDQFAYQDPYARRLLGELAAYRYSEAYTNAVARGNVKSGYVARYGRDLGILEEQYQQRTAELREELGRQRVQEVEAAARELAIQAQTLQDQYVQLAQEVDKKREEAMRCGTSSIDVEMMRAEIEHLDQVLTGIAEERERVKVELQSTSRINLVQKAEVPEVQDRTARIPLTIFGMIVGLGLPGVGLVLWDLRRQRINSVHEVSRGLGLPVLGCVPAIPDRIIRRLNGSAPRQNLWHSRLTEASDGIAARLLRKAQVDKTQVVLITSATGGDGKTTLATQLATSLARNGRSAVLVDFDLRRPAVDKIFGFPLRPGVCEYLRGGAELSELIREPGNLDMDVITAGMWDRQALTALSHGAAAGLFEQLRRQYDFVVVDASPVLPVADTRFLAQHVDAVVLSILRDVSQAPRVSEACEILKGFGVDLVEAVVTGPSEGGYKDLDYKPRLPAQETATE